MTVTTIAQDDVTPVTVGVDTHRDAHVAVALDQQGRRLGHASVPTTARGYSDLLAWAQSFGEVVAFGVEGTGCYGAGVARFLLGEGQLVIEVIRPDRQTRRRRGKSDLIDAEAAARSVQSGEATGLAKTGDDRVEMIRVLRIARTTAVKARTQAVNALRAVVVSAPPALRDQLRGLSADTLVDVAARLRPGAEQTTLAATKEAMRSLAQRYKALDVECARLDAQLTDLVTGAAPCLLNRFCVGVDTAGALLVAAGDNPERLRSEAAFSMLCGSSPREASSGQTTRHRLNRGGNRQANAALYRIVLVRMRHHVPTRAYVERRTKEGMSKLEIIRCLKRYVAREVYGELRRIARSEGRIDACAL
jgi:transposase